LSVNIKGTIGKLILSAQDIGATILNRQDIVNGVNWILMANMNDTKFEER
jgi:hypothetical protein